MNKSLSNRVLALAGVVQAAALVNDIATGQRADEQSLNSTLSSILKTEATDVPDVYGGMRGLGFGCSGSSVCWETSKVPRMSPYCATPGSDAIAGQSHASACFEAGA